MKRPVSLCLLMLMLSCTSTNSIDKNSRIKADDAAGTATGSGPEIKEENMEQTPVTILNPADLAGTWQGRLEVGVIQLRMVFNLHLTNEQTLTATVDSPDQGAFGIPVTGVVIAGAEITIRVDDVAGRYVGSLQAEGRLSGIWYQSNQEFPLELTKEAQALDYTRPQDPKKPYPYEAVDVVFNNPQAGINLAGTFTFPQQASAATAVILITGSGAQNRDEEIFGHRPFLVLADYLTRQGLAVLRYDDRGIGGSGGDPATATSLDYVTDVEAAIAWLQAQQLCRIGQLGLIGHSEGGMIAPLTAERSPRVDFIVLLAGPGCRGDLILMQQSEAIIRVKGMAEENIKQVLALNRQLYDLALQAEDKTAAATQIKQILLSTGMAAEQVESQVAGLLNPWMLYFMQYDPVPVLEKLTIPVLAVNGSLDLQVIPGENLPVIAAALERAGNPYYTVKEFPGLNHLFQTATSGLMEEYNTIQETISPLVLEYLGTWIKGLAAR